MFDSDLCHPTLLCPVDFSSSSDEAVATAVALARAEQGRIVLLHVIETGSVGRHGAPFTQHDMGELQSRLEEQASDAADLAIERWLETGEPSQMIVQLAAESGVDLIVIGARGAHAIGHTATGSNEPMRGRRLTSLSSIPDSARLDSKIDWLGSVAERVLRRASCGVITVGAPMTDNAHRSHARG